MAESFRLTLIARKAGDALADAIAALHAAGAVSEYAVSEDPVHIGGTEYQKLVLQLSPGFEKEQARSLLLQNRTGLAAYAIAPAEMPAIRLVVFDTDSTFINEEVIDEIAAFAGYKPQVAAITERAMRGELDFNAALAERVALLKDLPAATLDTVRAEKLSLTKGAAELTQTLHGAGVKTYLLSGGFNFVTNHFTRTLGMTGHFANELEITAGMLTGKTQGAIVNRQRKAELLREIAVGHRIDLSASVAVGDGANDLDMCRQSGLGIAFCAKPALYNETFAAIFERDLNMVLPLIHI